MYHTVRTAPKSNKKIVETAANSKLLTHIYMTAHFPGLIQINQEKRKVWRIPLPKNLKPCDLDL